MLWLSQLSSAGLLETWSRLLPACLVASKGQQQIQQGFAEQSSSL